MGRHATIGNSNVGHKNVTLKAGSQYVQAARVRDAASMAGPVKVREMTMDEVFAQFSGGQTYVRPDLTAALAGVKLLPVVKERGTKFRALSGTREELKISSGTLVLRKVTKTAQGQKFSAWIGELIPYGAETGRVLIAKLIRKGEPPVKSDTRDALLSRALLGR
jgi:hypothetical protein